jgi:hypothetical protein
MRFCMGLRLRMGGCVVKIKSPSGYNELSIPPNDVF